MFADIALNTKSSKRDDLFTYKIPKEMEGDIAVGQLVSVPLANRKINGIIIKVHNKKPSFETKEIAKIIDIVPLISDQQVGLARYISEYYWCGFSQAVFTMMPSNLRKRKTKVFKENGHIAILPYCQGGEKSFDKKKTSVKDDNITIYQYNNVVLTSKQKKALDSISVALKSSHPTPFLLHGVTNSGKTEVYLRAFAKVLENGGSGIFIIPEISLTPQSIKRFEQVFGKNQIAVIHSKLSIAERLKNWIDIRTGKKRIVIGSRSAIFAPVNNLQIIIVDEEHDLVSFKSDQTPRYELHNVAEKLAEISGAVLIFGSATPLVTSYARVVNGEWEYLSMQDRIDGSVPPAIKIIDMEAERRSKNTGIFSQYLLDALDMVLKNKKQALLFLNRRGMASYVICESCKKVSECSDCSGSLVYHSSDNKMWCHQCGKKYPVPTKCPNCGGLGFRFLGRGTEKIEDEIKHFFPNCKIERMDRDTMTADSAYENIFEKFKAGEIDILVGTQMIVHGWDIPSVDLAAVISLDEALMMPDYTAEEKAYQLITQLAGRTGRSSARGMLVLQTFNPDSWIFDVAAKGDYLGFVKKELDLRKNFGYPPYVGIVKLSLDGANKDVIAKKAGELKEKLEEIKEELKGNDVDIVGPVVPLIERRYGRYWINILVKLKSQTSNLKTVESFRDDLLNIVPKDWNIDIDPINML